MRTRGKIGLAALGLAAILAIAGIPQRVIADGLMYFAISEMPGDVAGEKEAFQGIAVVNFWTGDNNIWKDADFYGAEAPGVYTIETVCVDGSGQSKHMLYCKIQTTLDGTTYFSHVMALTRVGSYKSYTGETINRYTATQPVTLRSIQPPKMRFERYMGNGTDPKDFEDSAEMRAVISGYRTTPAIDPGPTRS